MVHKMCHTYHSDAIETETGARYHKPFEKNNEKEEEEKSDYIQLEFLFISTE